MTLLEVTDLHVGFPTPDGVVHAVRGVSFAVEAGRTLAVVGESGSGKSVATQTVTGLTRGAQISGSAVFDGEDLLTATTKQLEAVRGARIGMIFQDPLTSLHPYYTVGWQIVEMIRAHDRGISRRAARRRAVELLALVGIPQADLRVDDYPHQFSGGMRQRAMIAMSIALDPALLIADEPTTALDVTVQAQIITVLQDVQRELGTAIILITHDLGVVAEVADEIVVMYAGQVMERAARHELFYRFHHPYTEGLLASLPSRAPGRGRLTPIPGSPPSLITPPEGCPFRPRCAYAFDRCTQTPWLAPVFGRSDHESACWLPSDIASRDERVASREARVTSPHEQPA
ncbi:ABC transporter ATP-binding protein [Mumia sp. zg.B17]|uniref:ABC transporter ATP-binding protein n=1 Tax=Mumia sp. zg.B17 TaxID=2855446 RepID=UPI001C6E0A50|nr:ABC transporter ATP-binding protein [Mumia sp. zg.B17]MBW9205913.1 ABC transporter ATP-binding protein [Mumia sp. zg.B17]